MTELVHALPFPCLLTDEAGRNLDRNTAFSGLMQALSIKTVTGRLRFDEPSLQAGWQAALAQVKKKDAPAKHVLAASAGGRHWKLNLIVLRGGAADQACHVLVVCEELAAAPASTGAVAQAGRLTKAEQGVLAGLLQGQTARTIAQGRGASVNTVRSQITAILQKTGRNTQKELIASFGASSFGASSFGNSSFGLPFQASALDASPFAENL